MHICIYACIYDICIYAYIYAHIHICMHTCIYAYMHACMHICIHICIYAYMHAYMHICIHACICMHGALRVCCAKGGSLPLSSPACTHGALLLPVLGWIAGVGWGGSVNLPGWCWARIKQLALIGSSSSLHSEACKALGGSDGVVHSTISLAATCMRAVANDELSMLQSLCIHRFLYWSTTFI